jgi:hypothetical protein
MRVRKGENGQEFVRWISELSNNSDPNTIVVIPDYVNQPVLITDLISYIYPPDLLSRAATDLLTFRGQCLLTILNTTVSELNTHILGRLPGQLRIYQSVDSLDTDESSGNDLYELPVE